jgi:hypothetical protein
MTKGSLKKTLERVWLFNPISNGLFFPWLPQGGGMIQAPSKVQLGIDFVLVSLHHIISMYKKGWNPKFHESSFKNEDLVAYQSSGPKAEKRSKIVSFDFYKGKFGTRTFWKAAKNKWKVLEPSK